MALMINDRRNFAAGLMYAGIGVAMAFSSRDLTLGTPRNMGAGFFPFVVSIGLVITGLIVIAGSMHRTAERTTLGHWHLRPVITVSLAVLAFTALLRPGGLILAIPALIVICGLAAGRPQWTRIAGTIAVLLPATWLVFVKGLGLQLTLLPAGFGF